MKNKKLIMKSWILAAILLFFFSPIVYAQENGEISELRYSPSDPVVLENMDITIGVSNPSDKTRSYSMLVQVIKEGKIVNENEFTFTLDKSKNIVFTPQYTPHDLGEHQIIVTLYDKFKLDTIDTKVVTFNAVSQLGPFDIIVDPLTARVRPGFSLPTKILLENMGQKGVDIEVKVSVNCPDKVLTQSITVFVPSSEQIERLVTVQVCEQEGLYDVIGSIISFNRSWVSSSSQFFVNSSYIRLQFDAPEKIILTPGESSVIPFEVTNLGNQKISNLEFVVQRIPLTWQKINPPSVSDIDENETVIFIVNITIPKDAELKAYEARFTAVSDEVLERKISTIEVVPLTTSPKVPGAKISVITYILITVSILAILLIGGNLLRKRSREKESKPNEALKKIREKLKYDSL